MRIANTNLRLYSDHTARQQSKTAQSLSAWIGNPPAAQPTQPQTSGGMGAGVTVSITIQARAQQAEAAAAATPPAPSAAGAAPTDSLTELDAKQLTRVLVVERILGQKVRLAAWDAMAQNTALTIEQQTAPTRQGFGLDYEQHASYDESEQTDFAASGVVTTADGKQINLQVGLTMSRSFHQEQDLSLRVGDAVRKDPLVIDLPGTATGRSSGTFSFDLKGAGTAEQLPALDANSGFLALDSDGSGQIRSGAQLFGARTGDGFGELAQYDQNHDGWIDENDVVYSKLRVWKPTAQGGGTLQTLKQAGVGAIYLGAAETPFDLKDDQNVAHGQVRQTGLYLTDNGSAGTVQQVDLFA